VYTIINLHGRFALSFVISKIHAKIFTPTLLLLCICPISIIMYITLKNDAKINADKTDCVFVCILSYKDILYSKEEI